MTATLRKQLIHYQRLMIEAMTNGDLTAHDMYRQETRRLAEEIRQKEKTDCSQQSA